MSIKVPNVSELTLLDALISGKLNGAKLRAYQNNYTPVDTSVIGDFTQATFSGYAEITLNTWTAAALNASNKAETSMAAQTWTVAAGGVSNTVYGIYVVDAAGNLLYAEANPAGPVTLNTIGQFYSYLPRFTLKSEV